MEQISTIDAKKVENGLVDTGWERQQTLAFTEWIKYQLRKTNICIKDISTDLRDGEILIRLLEEICVTSLPPVQKGTIRANHIKNIEYCFAFVQSKGSNLAGIQPEQIVDGHLGSLFAFIWAIISRFIMLGTKELMGNDALLKWVCQRTQGYSGVSVKNFKASFSDGMTFNALIHSYHSELFDYNTLNPKDPDFNLNHAFSVAESILGVPKMLDVESIKTSPDSRSIMTYVLCIYHVLNKNQLNPQI
ncbi:Alpha-actinin, sarcomeric [Thelohanellus kitauei]|uniref:Alpha-actinin, sarcomeric n=1 Tax=Thelohanellus kitauei TaxID=669202 RepID=A0A0C2MMT4_THEKT|nr:Alpha-actinin, sarcomeric [Thelohanellus kitauei]